MVTIITSELTPKFSCEKCDFKCCKKGDLNRHLLTIKHKRTYNVTQSDTEIHINIIKCDNCLKIYKSRNGLWLHLKNVKNLKHLQ